MEPAPGLRLLEERSDGRVGRFTIEVGSASPFFDGHFPGRPVLPAVAQILLVERLCRRAGAPRGRVAGIEALRLLRPVAPGDVVAVRIDWAGGGALVRFEISDARGPISRGSLHLRADARP
jgi:3-hydroxymyristoyl/3-hydroxydecanoyl-(acyl carrier protein) dehydratase